MKRSLTVAARLGACWILGVSDWRISDRGVLDRGVLEQCVLERGVSDWGRSDQRVVDWSVLDWGRSDQGVSDWSVSDWGVSDRGVSDWAVQWAIYGWCRSQGLAIPRLLDRMNLARCFACSVLHSFSIRVRASSSFSPD